MNARQQAEYRDDLARHGIALQDASRAEARQAEMARKKRAYKRRPKQVTLPPKSGPMPPATDLEAELAARLLPHVAPESPLDRERHALGVARMILQGRR